MQLTVSALGPIISDLMGRAERNPSQLQLVFPLPSKIWVTIFPPSKKKHPDCHVTPVLDIQLYGCQPVLLLIHVDVG